MQTSRSHLRLALFPWGLGLLLVSLLACRGPDLVVRITQPEADVRTRQGSLSLQVTVEGGSADRVELLRDGQSLAVLEAPYAFTWDLSSLEEGTYELRARAWRGGDAYTSDPRSVTVDHTGPSVVSSVPADGAVDVQSLAPIVLAFSEPMHPDSLQPRGIELLAGNTPVPFTVALSEDGLQLTLTPQPRTWHGRYGEVRLHQATDLAGNLLRSPGKVAAWTLAPWQKLPALGSTELDSIFAIHADAAGVPLVARYQGQAIVVKRWSGTAWEGVGAPILTHSSNAPEQLSLATSPEGHPWVAWTTAIGTSVNMQAHAQAWTGSAWQSLGPTPDQPGLPAGYPGVLRLRVSPQGTGYLVTESSTAPIKRWSGTAWEALPTPPVTQLSNIDLAVDADGPVVALSGRQAGEEVMRTSVWRWVDGGWQALGSPFNSGTTVFWEPYVLLLELDASGRPVVGYISNHPNGFTLYFWVHAWNGTDWPLLGRPPQLGSFGGMPPKWPSLTVDPTGAPWVSFPSRSPYAPNPSTYMEVRRWDGTAWVYAPNAYLGSDAWRPAQFTRAGPKAVFGAGRSQQEFGAGLRVELY
ncbi:MAG TPA: Ig-like domain-containing protein [Myxococcus sp.]|nr:Ig-like domain-containing protein [Myxococcus sp.]